MRISAHELKEMKLGERSLNYLYTIRDFTYNVWVQENNLGLAVLWALCSYSQKRQQMDAQKLENEEETVSCIDNATNSPRILYPATDNPTSKGRHKIREKVTAFPLFGPLKKTWKTELQNFRKKMVAGKDL